MKKEAGGEVGQGEGGIFFGKENNPREAKSGKRQRGEKV